MSPLSDQWPDLPEGTHKTVVLQSSKRLSSDQLAPGRLMFDPMIAIKSQMDLALGELDAETERWGVTDRGFHLVITVERTITVPRYLDGPDGQ